MLNFLLVDQQSHVATYPPLSKSERDGQGISLFTLSIPLPRLSSSHFAQEYTQLNPGWIEIELSFCSYVSRDVFVLHPAFFLFFLAFILPGSFLLLFPLSFIVLFFLHFRFPHSHFSTFHHFFSLFSFLLIHTTHSFQPETSLACTTDHLMSRISHNIEPLCYTSHGVHLYAIARGYILKDHYSKPDFFIVRSNPHPASLGDLSWEVIESSPTYPDTDIQRIVYPHTALCAWNPTSSSFAMLVNGLRSGWYIDRLGVSLSSQLLSSTFSSGEPHAGDSTAQGRSLLMPISNHAAHQGNTSDILYYSNSWAQVDLESSTREILFTFYPKMDTLREPQVR